MEREHIYRQGQEALFDDDEIFIDDIEDNLKHNYPEAEKQYKRWRSYRRIMFGTAILSLLGATHEAVLAEFNKNHGIEYVSHEQNSYAGLALAIGLTVTSLILDQRAIEKIKIKQLDLSLRGSKGKFTNPIQLKK